MICVIRVQKEKMSVSFREDVEEICKKDGRYQPEAYAFLVEALDVTMKEVFKANPNHDKNLTGKELLEGIRAHALAEFGPLTNIVLAEWGVRSTLDFGAILEASREAGIVWHFVEQDEVRMDAFESMKISYDNLMKTGRFV